MVTKWSVGVPLLFTILLYGTTAFFAWMPLSAVELREHFSPRPSSQQVASPLPTLLTPCEVFSSDALISLTGAQYLPPRLSANQRVDGLLIQRCLWLSADEKLTPTISLSIISPETASSSAIAEYWQHYIDQNQVNRRFRTVEQIEGQPVLVDSRGTHALLPAAIVTIQASMSTPAQNQATEWQLLTQSWQQLSKFYSSTQSVAESEGQSE